METKNTTREGQNDISRHPVVEAAAARINELEKRCEDLARQLDLAKSARN